MLTIILSLLACLLSFTIFLRSRKPNRTPYPPGPKPKTIIGNAYDIPKEKPWLTLMEWSKQLNSDILHLSSLNSHIIILNKMEDAIALLDKRSEIYSNRPSVKIREMMGLGLFTSSLPYGNTWRKHRRMWQEGLRKDFLPTYHQQQVERVHVLLGLLLSDPAEFREHCKTVAVGITLATGYGYELESTQKDRLVEMGDAILKAASKLLLSGSTLIHVLPFLGDIPPWFPGAATQRRAAEVKKLVAQFKLEPFNYVKKQMLLGSAKECIVTRLLERNGSDDENLVNEAAASIYFAGSPGLHCGQLVFIFAMALHPFKQKKAQEEIDRVVGTERLPTFDDRISLPYVEALYREVLRWRPIGPLNALHSPMQDNLYKGFYIPKNAIIMANVWAISRDEECYKNPDDFVPERFFNEDGTLNNDTVSYGFGFGRRICAGRAIADSTIWLMIVSMLSTFNMAKAKDAQGNEIDIDLNGFTDAVTSTPLPFKCSITPRSKQAEMLIRDAARVEEQGKSSHL